MEEEDSEPDDSATPEEEIEAAYQNLREGLVNDLLETVKSCSSAFFEQLVIDLLVRMGYGGTRKDAGQAIGRSGDGGILTPARHRRPSKDQPAPPALVLRAPLW